MEDLDGQIAAGVYMTENPEFIFRKMLLAGADFDSYRACFAEQGASRPNAWFDWQYGMAPGNRMLVWFAVPRQSPNKVAAIYAASSRWVSVAGGRVLACHSMDTLTHPDYRGKGLFVKLASHAYDQYSNDGIALVYGTPNGNSAHGFFQRLGWKELEGVPMRMKPLRLSGLVRRLTGGRFAGPAMRLVRRRTPRLKESWNLGEVRRFGPEYDRLWEAFSVGIPSAVARDSEFLNWRTRKPGEDYLAKELREGDNLLGYVVYKVKDGGGGRNAYLMELIYDLKQPEVGTTLLRVALQDCVNRGAEVALAWNFDRSPNHPAFRSAGFLAVPPRFQPVKLHFGARDFTGGLPAAASPNSWYLSYFDSDTI